MATAEILPTDAAKVVRRKVYERIEECYDEIKKRYKPSMDGGRHSDRSISAELLCAEELVCKVREEFFGPNTVPSEPEQLKSIQDDLAYLQKEAGEILDFANGLKIQAKTWQKKAEEMHKRIEDVCAEYGWGGSA